VEADDVPPVLTVSVRDTADFWDNTTGGRKTGTAVLNKLQLGGSFAGDRLGLSGWTLHLQIFRTDGTSLSDKVGDIQTVDSIDARPVTRLFESWLEKKFGDEDHSLAFRFGLMDLNSDYDSIQTASLFVNSSQGIAPDLARSGRNGPSIYPVSSLGFRISWLPSRAWTFRLAAFDGVPGDPKDPDTFVSVKLDRSDGALLIGQADYHLSDKAKIEAGAWRYSTAFPDILPSTSHMHPDQGAYISIEGPLPKLEKWSGWTRLGVANGSVQQVGAYFGAGLVGQGIIEGRPEDRLGVAIARAENGSAARAAFGLRSAETSYEFSYQVKVRDTLALQPDLQYVVHPSAEAHLPNALILGLRVVLTAGYPKKAPANEATDPTVPPEGAQSTDDNGAGDHSAPEKKKPDAPSS
jgi:porin